MATAKDTRACVLKTKRARGESVSKVDGCITIIRLDAATRSGSNMHNGVARFLFIFSFLCT